jgi:thiamine kinase-like enzyme
MIMDVNLAKNICKKLNLGKIQLPLKNIKGGLLHKMYFLQTEKASYAVKCLCDDVDISNESVVENYNKTEKISELFNLKNIPTISAIKSNNSYLQIIDGIGFLVYPWRNAKALQEGEVVETRALKIAGLISDMHRIDLQVDIDTPSSFSCVSSLDIEKAIAKSKESNLSFSNELYLKKKQLLDISNNYKNIVLWLGENSVVSHCDLDQKNVLWDDFETPFLIDWESARKINPIYEIVNASLDWSGVGSDFNEKIFYSMIKEYEKKMPNIKSDDYEKAFIGVLGNWLNWLIYNVNRANKNGSEMAIKQVFQTLNTIENVKKISS